MTDNTLARNELFAQMESDKPYAAYVKKILGKVVVTVWDNILEKPTEVVLHGDPRTPDPDCIVKVWSAKEKLFFERNNVKHIKNGMIVPFEVKESAVVEEKTIEQSTDEELKEIVNSKYLALTNKLNKITSVAVLFRMLTLAEEMEKSEKITGAIQARISEVQAPASYPEKLEVEISPKED